MTTPRRFLIRMILFLLMVGAAAALLFQPLFIAFQANQVINGVILGILFLGILNNFRQVILLYPETRWIEDFQGNRPTMSDPRPLRLLAPMAKMVGEKRGRLNLTAPAMRSLLDGIASRLDESRDLSRYTIGLLIFLGLLGTFWGLMLTVGSIGDVIRSINFGSGDPITIFADLKHSLEQPLHGMGTAFTSSLFGLSGSLVLGFLDLQAGQAQNRFFTDLEDWLSGQTRLSSGMVTGDGDQSVPYYVQALLEQTAESLDNLQRTMARGEESRIAVNSQIRSLSEKIGMFADQTRNEQALMMRLADSQAEFKVVLSRLTDALTDIAQPGMDEATRGHIRNLDASMARLVDETVNGREELIREVRSDFKLLARTVAAAVDGTPQ